MRLSKEMPELSNVSSTIHLTGIEAAIAYLSAPDEVKAQVDESAEPVTEKQINDLKKQYQALEEEKRLSIGANILYYALLNPFNNRL